MLFYSAIDGMRRLVDKYPDDCDGWLRDRTFVKGMDGVSLQLHSSQADLEY